MSLLCKLGDAKKSMYRGCEACEACEGPPLPPIKSNQIRKRNRDPLPSTKYTQIYTFSGEICD